MNEVKHDIQNERFIIEVEDEKAYLSYSINGDTINFNSTYTPPTLRGMGLARLVVEKAFDFAKGENLKVTSNCSYVIKFVDENDEYKNFMK